MPPNRKILLFHPYACSAPHNEVALEVALNYREKGYEPHFIVCKSDLLICDPNIAHYLPNCLRCTSLSKNSLDNIGIKKAHRHPIHVERHIDEADIPRFSHIRELKKYQVNGIPVGEGVAFSIIVALTRDSEPDMEKYRFYYLKAIPTFLSIYHSVIRTLQQLKPDVFYLFHGHSMVYAAARAAAAHLQVEHLIGEREFFHEYILMNNHGGLNVDKIAEQIRTFKDKMLADPEGKTIGHSWFTRNRAGNKEQLFNFLRVQQTGSLPSNFDSKKRNIAIYGSSEDELEASDQFRNPWFENQSEAMTYLLAQVREPEFHFYLRVHPNLRGRSCTQNTQLKSLEAPNLTILDANSPIDSYALMTHCEKVLSFGSTMGVEATYWGMPSILAGRAFHERLGTSYIPTSPANLIHLIREVLVPLPTENALTYGYWWKKRGQPFNFVSPSNVATKTPTRVNGKPIQITWTCKALLLGHRLWSAVKLRVQRLAQFILKVDQTIQD